MTFAADGSAAEVALQCTDADLRVTNLDLTPFWLPIWISLPPVGGRVAAKRQQKGRKEGRKDVCVCVYMPM